MKMIDSKFIDSSVWLAYFFEGEHKEIIENEEILFLSAVSLVEIRKRLIEKKIPDEVIREKMDFIKKRSNIINIDSKIVDKAVEIFVKYKLATIDSIIYASSLSNKAILITRDNDFRGMPDVQLF